MTADWASAPGELIHVSCGGSEGALARRARPAAVRRCLQVHEQRAQPRAAAAAHRRGPLAAFTAPSQPPLPLPGARPCAEHSRVGGGAAGVPPVAAEHHRRGQPAGAGSGALTPQVCCITTSHSPLSVCINVFIFKC